MNDQLKQLTEILATLNSDSAEVIVDQLVTYLYVHMLLDYGLGVLVFFFLCRSVPRMVKWVKEDTNL